MIATTFKVSMRLKDYAHGDVWKTWEQNVRDALPIVEIKTRISKDGGYCTAEVRVSDSMRKNLSKHFTRLKKLSNQMEEIRLVTSSCDLTELYGEGSPGGGPTK